MALLAVAACTRREEFALVVTGLSRGETKPLPLPIAVCDRAPGQTVLRVLGSGFVPAVASANQNAKLLVPVVSLHDSRGNTSVVAEPELLDEGTIQVRVGPYNGSGQDGVYSVEVAGADDAQTATLSNAIQVLPPPTVSSFTPSHGCWSSPTSFTFVGGPFSPGTVAYFDSVQIAGTSVTVRSSTELDVSFPAFPQAPITTADILLQDPAGCDVKVSIPGACP